MKTRNGSLRSKVNLLGVIALCGVLGWSSPPLGAAPNITGVVETGGDNEATDTITAKWTGVTFNTTIADEPILNTPVGTPYTVGLFGEDVPSFVDRAHQWNGATAALPIPVYLAGQEYIMIGNDNRDNATLRLDISVAERSVVFLLLDNRVGDRAVTSGGSGTESNVDPPFTGNAPNTWPRMAWVNTEGFQPLINGYNRAGSMSRPDEIGIDETSPLGVGPGNSINQYMSLFYRVVDPGTFSMYQLADVANYNMYGVVVKVATPPTAPTGLEVVALNNAARLYWAASPAPSPYKITYNIKRSTTSGGPYAPVATTSSLSYLDEAGLANGTPYYYVVSAVSFEGEGDDSVEASVTPAPAPTNVTAVGGTGQVVVSWDDAGALYRVKRSTVSGGPYADIATLVAGGTYTDTTVAAGTTYYYAVIAESGGGLSLEAAGTTIPSVPVLTAELLAATVIRLQWTTPDPVLTGFSIERSTDGVTFAPLATVPATQRSYVDTALAFDTAFSYRVQASNPAGSSDYSAVASVHTPVYGLNVNFANATFATNFPGYVNDYGAIYGDRGNGFSYGWDADNAANARERNNAASADKRYDTFNHLQKQTPSRIWEIAVPNGYYRVRIASGDPTATDSVFQFDVEGVTSQTYVPTTGNWWGEFSLHCLVTDGRLTINSGPSAANNKINFIDIYAAELPAYAATVLGQGPIAYYRFNDGITVPTFDAAVNRGTLGAAANGVYQGLPLHGQPGALVSGGNTSTKFNGSSQGTAVPYSAALNPVPPFSVEGWANPDTIRAAGSLVSPMASLLRSGTAARGWIIYQDAGGWNFRLGDAVNNYTVNLTGGGTPATNTWYHLVMTYDGATAIAYVNGVEIGRTETNNFAPNPSQPLGIGMRGDAGFRFPGRVDEVAVYPNILSAADVAAHYQNGTSTTPSPAYDQLVLALNPIAYYRLDEGAYVPKIAPNIGSLGAVANGGYYNGAVDGSEAPRGPQFLGFEADNTAVQLNGSSAFVGTLISLMNNRPAFTMSGWIRRNAAQAARTGLWGQNDLVEFGYISDTTIQAWTDAGLDLTPNPFSDGQWSHLAVVSDGPTIAIYTNGTLAVSRAHSLPGGGVSAFLFNMGGGGIFDGSGNFFNGQMDEVAVFDKALSPGAIANQIAAVAPTVPRITVNLPAGVTLYAGDTLTLGPEVVGTPPLRYQWFFEFLELEGETNPTLVIPNVNGTDDSGQYWVEVSNDYGGPVTSAICNVEVLSEAPTITQQPAPVTVYAGFTARFTVVALGGQNMTFQWSKGETPITDATNATLVLSPVQPGDAGDYKVLVTNPNGSTESAAATLTVLEATADTYEATLVAQMPVAYWSLDEAAGPTAYDYVGLHHATALGGVTFGTEGPRPPSYPGMAPDNTAVQLNGTDALLTLTPSLVNGVPAFTMVGWINLAAAPAARTALWGQNDALEFGFHTATTIGIWSPTGGYVEVPHGFVVGQWYFVATTGDGTSMKLYINGALVAGGGTAVTANYGTSAYPFNIGAMVLDASGNYFSGIIDQVAVYGRALSAEEICNLYVSGTRAASEMMIELVDFLVADDKPLGTPQDAVNRGAAWLPSSADGVSVTREGVMEFVAAEGDQITIAPDPAFDSTQGTIMFWMRSAGVVGSGNEGAMLFDRRGAAGDVIVQWANGGQIFVQASGGANSFLTTGSVSDNRWHHVAYVYDQSAAGSISIYIDGVLDKSQANSAAWSWLPTQRIELGRSHDGWWYLYNGQMDDFRFYNRMLNATEIGEVHSAGALVDTAALQVQLDFNAPPGGVAISWTGCGTLEEAIELIDGGPGTEWTVVPGAASPYLLLPRGETRFFRVRQ